jgi:hypothetical protein
MRSFVRILKNVSVVNEKSALMSLGCSILLLLLLLLLLLFGSILQKPLSFAKVGSGLGFID